MVHFVEHCVRSTAFDGHRCDRSSSTQRTRSASCWLISHTIAPRRRRFATRAAADAPVTPRPCVSASDPNAAAVPRRSTAAPSFRAYAKTRRTNERAVLDAHVGDRDDERADDDGEAQPCGGGEEKRGWHIRWVRPAAAPAQINMAPPPLLDRLPAGRVKQTTHKKHTRCHH